MKRKIVEESRTLSSLSLEMDASGRLKPMVKLYFESPQEWKAYAGMAQEAFSTLRGAKQEILVLERDAWGRFVSPGKSKQTRRMR